MILESDGIIGKAVTAARETKKASAKEEIELAIAEEATWARVERSQLDYENVWTNLRQNDKNFNAEKNEENNNYRIFYKGFEFLIDNEIVTYIGEQEDNFPTNTELTSLGSVTVDGTTYTDSYEIWNEAQLEDFRNRVNNGETFENCILWQKADINLNSENWEPIGNLNNYFSGRYNGESHTITGINVNSTSIYQGLFGYILGSEQQNVIIENLTVEGNITGAHTVGGVVGWAGYTTIRNCINKTNVTSTDYEYIDNQIENECSTGGITGKIGIYGGDIINCENYGTITSTYGGPGGIVGWCRKGNIKECKNYASINNSHVFKVGGIVACMEEGNIEKCYNSGRIEGNAHVGGICGYGGYNDSGNYKEVNIKETSNTGEIIAAYDVGGIIGRGRIPNIEQSSNYGYVCSTNTENNNNWSDVGGIAGYLMNTNAKISYCYNVGNIEANRRGIAGIVGYLNGGAACKINYCYNIGDITNNDDDYAGRTAGIVGMNEMGIGEVSNCWQLQNCIKKGVDTEQLNVIEKTEAELKALDWDNFAVVVGKNDGYPILEWEK